jgi:multidrug efflux pump subunit AcrB
LQQPATRPTSSSWKLLILLIFGYQFTVIALIGIILLTNRHREEERYHDGGLRHHGRERDGMSPVGAIRQACLLRFRPILMTTMAVC